MLGGIDHPVIAVPDLGTAIARYTALDFPVGPGGRHPTGTRNVLIGFTDGAYLELMADEKGTCARQWNEERIPAMKFAGRRTRECRS